MSVWSETVVGGDAAAEAALATLLHAVSARRTEFKDPGASGSLDAPAEAEG